MQRIIMMTAVVAVMMAMVTTARADDKPKYVVIVHAANKVTELSRGELRNIYLKKMTRWKDETIAVPFDLLIDAPLREVFSEQIFDKSPRNVQTEWRQRIFAGQGTPPRELKDDATTIATVGATPGAIGYVTAGTPLPASVHVVNITQ